MEGDEDISSPKVRRRMWRRVWIGLAIFVIVTPVLLWVAIDQGGKREWKRVQADLRAKGEPTTIAELNLPQHSNIPEEENFGAVKWIRANEDGGESTEMEEVRRRLALYRHYLRDRQAREDFNWSMGNPFIGKPSDLALYTRSLDIAARELRIEPPAESEPYHIRLTAYLDLHADIWAGLLEAKERKHAIALPLLSERYAQTRNPYHVSFQALEISRTIVSANRYRALLAAELQAPTAFVDYFEVGSQLTELCANERISFGILVAITNTAVMTNSFAEALWNDNFVATLKDEHFRRLQISLQRSDFHVLFHQAQQTDLALTVDSLLAFPQHRKELVQEWGGHGPPSWALSIAPSGWFASNGAYLGASYEDYLLAPFRDGACLGEILESAAHWQTEIKGFNPAQEINYSLALMSTGSPEKILQRAIYSEARRRQALIVCALYRYRLGQNNAFPESLTQLTPAYLTAIPNDPIDGQPMRYAVDQSETDFRLWSIGFDGIDDGGKLDLLTEEPQRTRIERPNYIGDWPWPTQAREFKRPESE